MQEKGPWSFMSHFLDLRSRVSLAGEGAVMGIAFHPKYKTNGLFYVVSASAAHGTSL